MTPKEIDSTIFSHVIELYRLIDNTKEKIELLEEIRKGIKARHAADVGFSNKPVSAAIKKKDFMTGFSTTNEH